MDATGGKPSWLAMPRTRGMGSGIALVLLGLWGALIPLVGPYFDWVVGTDEAWGFTEGRFWLSILPGLVVALGGTLMIFTANRLNAGLGAWLALAGGAWFVVGRVLARVWSDGESLAGTPQGGTTTQAFELLTYYYGLGALIIGIASFALGRGATRSVKDMERLTAEHGTVTEPEEAQPSTGRFTRDKDTAPAEEQRVP